MDRAAPPGGGPPPWRLGELDPREDDVSVELPISTLARILKVTHFSKTVAIVCEPGLPVRLTAQLGSHGSEVSVYIQQDAGGAGGSAAAAVAAAGGAR